eukprot:CAMPEP_0184527224 /NCGR_PEP_ID=MMETSP0198_2-20121128/11080_1 /TAXON_ID=1112570 /ORGANISM="Thraustochytrium sp., Strain LLF1b" /LENGTH=438 /DNA_ID=CAMNT_0026918861 /DNA_START=198 /DNA_END=1514 /DNA_ORIENTATION=+
MKQYGGAELSDEESSSRLSEEDTSPESEHENEDEDNLFLDDGNTDDGSDQASEDDEQENEESEREDNQDKVNLRESSVPGRPKYIKDVSKGSLNSSQRPERGSSWRFSRASLTLDKLKRGPSSRMLSRSDRKLSRISEVTWGLLGSSSKTLSVSSTASNCSSRSYIDKNYNYELPSYQVYKSVVERYAGQYTATRRKLDKDFHGFYREDRQLVQDQIISYVLRASGSNKKQRKPWIIFTAGAMGSGKSHTLRHLKARPELADLKSFVVIDQDEIRSLLPEWGEYMKKSSRKGGALLQKESGYMCEIALSESLSHSRNIIFDSSLRDTNWWKHEFARIRETYPKYHLAILYIKTDLETAIRRTEARAMKTGRVVPVHFVEESYEQSARSFEVLKEEVDLTAVIDSTAPEPVFIDPPVDEFCATWKGRKKLGRSVGYWLL